MEKICLDFETAFHFLRGDLAVVRKLRNYAPNEEICITSITMAQLMMAITNDEIMRSFLNSVSVLPFDSSAARIAAGITREFDEAGNEQKHMDIIMTAAICLSNRAHLFSCSPSLYDGIKGLKKV